jgi:PST family polysaccharide transporter
VISFSWLFGAFSTLGLEAIAVREIVKYPDKQEEINGTVFTLRLLGGIIAIVLIASTVFIHQYLFSLLQYHSSFNHFP